MALAAGTALAALTMLAAASAASAATFTVTTTDDGSGPCTALECTLREAVEAANAATEPSKIVVPAGVYELTDADFATGSDLDVEAEVTIEGAGAEGTIIAQRAECVCRVLFIDSPAVVISGVTIQEGFPIENPLGEIGGDILFQPEGPGALRLERDVIAAGVAREGGGVYSEEGELEILESTIEGNSAEAGGGVYYENDSGATALFEGDTFVGNEADEGGGLAVEVGEAFIVNSTFNENGGVSAHGGAIFADDGTLELLNDTLAGDSAEPMQGGGASGSEIYGVSGDSFEIVNTIVGPAGAGQIGAECFLDADLLSDADIDAGSSCGFETAGGSLVETDPLLGPLAANGGPTQTMALNASSPAIDAADDAACPATDQRGIGRPQGSGCDIGAYEYRPPEKEAGPKNVPTTTPSTPKPGSVCRQVQPTATSFKPKLRPGHVVPGVRVRLATDQPSRLAVTATLLWNDEGRSRTTGLGKLLTTVNHWRRVRFPIPVALRDKLPLGTAVKVRLQIKATPLESTSCGANVGNRTVHVHVVKVFPHAVQFARPG